MALLRRHSLSIGFIRLGRYCLPCVAGHGIQGYRLPFSTCASLTHSPPGAATAASTCSVKSLPSEADVVIVGGGVAGGSALYHLCKLGLKNVLLLESSRLTAGTTWHSAGIIWSLLPSIGEVGVRHLIYMRELAGSLQAESGVDPGWVQKDVMFVASSEERLNDLKRSMTVGRCFGVESHVIPPSEMKRYAPLMNTSDVVGGLYCPGTGSLDATNLTSAYCRAASRQGAQVFENCAVTAIDTEEGTGGSRRVSAVHTSQGVIRTGCVLNCAGGWAPKVGALAGVSIPITVMKREYVISEPVDGVRNSPIVFDFGLPLYFMPQGESLAYGGYEENPRLIKDLPDTFHFSLYDLDWDNFASHMSNAIHRYPCLETAGVKSTISGPEAFTPDGSPLIGESPEVRGFFMSCGFSSTGIMFSAGHGRQIAEWIATGKPSMDMWPYDIKRFGRSYVSNDKWRLERCHEAYHQKRHIKYPHGQPLAGRNIHKDPLHQELLSAGCVFEVAHGWECPSWFLTSGTGSGALPETQIAKVLPYDYYGVDGHVRHKNYAYASLLQRENTMTDLPGSHEMIAAECHAATAGNSAALCNMTSLGKFLLCGRDSRHAIDWLCSNDVGGKGKVAWTYMLNKDGGVEADVTVAMLPDGIHPAVFGQSDLISSAGQSHEVFYVVCGTAFATYVEYHIRRVLEDEGLDAVLVNTTHNMGVLRLMGERIPDILKVLMAQDLDSLSANQAEVHSPVQVAGCPSWLMCLDSNHGRNYELHMPMESLLQVYRELRSVAEASGYIFSNVGFRAVAELSSESNHCQWGRDIGPTDTPLEAGFGDLCSSQKKYLGHDAIAEQRKRGVSRRRIAFVTRNKSDIIYPAGGEAVLRDGEVVGHVRHVSYSHQRKQFLMYAYLPALPGTSFHDREVNSKDRTASHFEIERLGKRHAVHGLPS